MVMRVVLILLFFFAGNVLAALPARYMQTTKDAAIWSQIGDKMVTVGNIRAGQILSVTPVAADYYAFKFGFGVGFIDKGHLESVQGKQKVEDGLGDLNKPLSNQNLVTWKDTPVYNAPDISSARLAYWWIICVTPLLASCKAGYTKPGIRSVLATGWLMSAPWMRRKTTAFRF